MTRDPKSAPLTAHDEVILGGVDRAIRQGRDLLRWWQRTHATASYGGRFPLIRQVHRPDSNFGFLEDAALADGVLPVLGVIQDHLYDWPKAAGEGTRQETAWIRGQLEAFMLRSFLRVSTRLVRQAAPPGPSQEPPELLADFSLCGGNGKPRHLGWGYEQWYYKLAGSGEVGKFPDSERLRMIELRDVDYPGRWQGKYAWIVFKVRLFNSDFTLHLAGTDGPKVTAPVKEEVYTVLTPEFLIADAEEKPDPWVEGRRVVGEYGYGYSVVPDPTVQSIFGYGPNRLQHTIETISLRVLDDGQVRAHMNFVAPQPTKFLEFDPVDWGFRLADLLSFGAASRLLAPVKTALVGLQPDVDPLRLSLNLANTLSGGLAAEQLCLSWNRLVKDIMAMHCAEAYDFFMQSASNFKLVPDWTAADEDLPEWAREGTITDLSAF